MSDIRKDALAVGNREIPLNKAV
ncbi:MAG: hypothetical protein UZ21_OP11001001085, partial [Microgenomates bacterium OLB22]